MAVEIALGSDLSITGKVACAETPGASWVSAYFRPPGLVNFRYSAIFFSALMTGLPVKAAWQDDIGFVRLQSLAGAGLPTAITAGVSQIEAPDGGFYSPNIALFPNKTFVTKSGITSTSNHAQTVATNFYGSASQLTGAMPVDLYNANGWLFADFLKTDTNQVPLPENRKVQNHSWIGSTGSFDANINQRIDYAIHRDGFVCVAGENNGNSTTLPSLLGQSYNSISVGLRNGSHSAGFTTLDGSGRVKPDIVAPETATSWATPLVSGSAALLYQKLTSTQVIALQDRPKLIKALLLASARKDTVSTWSNSTSQPLDSRYGAGELNVFHAYNTLIAGEHAASASVAVQERGWDLETVGGNSSKTYFFTIPAGPSTRFCTALAWHRIVTTATSGGGPNQVRTWSSSLANLNLRLYQASGTTLGSELTHSASGVDNLEMIYNATLSPGDYAMEVENVSPDATGYALAWQALPVVSIAATDASASEVSVDPGVITISRSGDLSLPLWVPLTISGTAVAGSHYAALPTSVTIPAGQSSTTLQVTPVADALAQGTRTVIASIGADFSFVRDVAETAVVNIADKPFDAWRFAEFSPVELGNPSISGAIADPDGDGIENLLEYAFGLDPQVPGLPPLVTTEINGYLAISATKNPAATDLIWSAESGDAPDAWSPAQEEINTSTSFLARDGVLKTSASRRFIRIQVSLP